MVVASTDAWLKSPEDFAGSLGATVVVVEEGCVVVTGVDAAEDLSPPSGLDSGLISTGDEEPDS